MKESEADGGEGREDQNPEATQDDEARDEEHVVEPDNALPEISIDQLSDRMKQAVANAGWTELMPVQARAIPYMLAKRDLMVQSRTGSGKTGAFVLPILDRIDEGLDACQALALVPTRELARQVARDSKLLCSHTGVRTVPVYGGVGYGEQLDAFKQGAHIVVGTPGRVLDHLLRKSLKLDRLKILVFDEADRMLSMGFYPDMREVQRFLHKRRINGYMFSATFPPHVMRLAGEFLHKPEVLSLSRDHVHVVDTAHAFYDVPGVEKDRVLVRIIELENPTGAIIFCNTKSRVNYVTAVLQRFGYDADALSSDLAQAARDRVLGRVRKGELRFLVATDVAARGIDVPDLSHVFIYEVPEDPESYIHRAGRTGRAGAKGVAITLSTGIERYQIQTIAAKYKIDMVERPLPTDEQVAEIVSERAIALLEAQLRQRDKLQVERMQRFVPLARSLSQSDDELAVMAMLLDDRYQAALHAPANAPADSASPPRREASGSGRSERGRSGGGRSGGRRSGGGGRSRRR